MTSPIPVHAIALPDYTAEREPDYRAVGTQLDQVIETHFSEKPMAIRGISLADHPGWSLEDLVATILKLGTDRYDPDREGVHYPESSSLLDFFACTFVVVAGKLQSSHYQGDRCPSGSALGEVVGDFYLGARADRGYSIRLDLLMIYDLDHLDMVLDEPDGELTEAEIRLGGLRDCCLFRFKHPERKPEALMGVIKILS